MPTSKKFGTPGEANRAIGGVPVMHYLDFKSRGRGQVVRLMWEDAGIAYEDVRYSNEELPDAKEGFFARTNPAKTLPIIELNGKILTQSYAILRHFSRLLGKYDGETEESKYFVDAVCDIGIDWRTLFVQAVFAPTGPDHYERHQKGDRVNFLKALDLKYGQSPVSGGPFVLGKELSYADMVIYQICHDEDLTKGDYEGLKEYPRLHKMVEALEARPNIRSFLKSDRYLG